MLSLFATTLLLTTVSASSAPASSPAASESDLIVDVSAGLGRDVVVVVAASTDPAAASSLLARLSLASVPATVVTLRELPVRLHPAAPPEGRCDLMPEEDPAGHRRPLRAKLYLALLAATEAAAGNSTAVDVVAFLRAAAATTAHCLPTVVRADMYHRENVFLYLDLTPEEEAVVLSDETGVRMHPYVGSIRPMKKKLMLSRYDIYSNKPSRAFWVPSGSSVSSPADVFPDLPMRGYHFTVAAMPYDASVTVDPAENQSDPERLYTNHDGLEVRMVEAISEVLDFTFDFVNPADQMWGSIEGGRWTGILGAVLEGKAHFGISGIGRMINRNQVLHQSTGFQRTQLIFLSKSPGRTHSYFTIILPLSHQVWIAILVAFLAFQVCLWLVARAEEKLATMAADSAAASGRGREVQRRVDLRQWSKLSGASWYTFGTLIGESITRDTRSEGAWALRLFIGVWLWSAFLLTAGYGGNLRAFLMNPPLEDPIDSLQEVADSGLPWEMGIYGEDVEMEMARSEDPLMRTIWEGKVPVLGEPFAFEKVAKVAAGKTVLIDWKNKLETSIFFAFTLPDGRGMVDRYELPIVYSKVENTHAFYPLNPWTDRYSKVISRLVDTGLVQMFWDAVRRNLKKKYGTTKYLPKTDDSISPIIITDYLGLFIFFSGFVLISALVFLVEFGSIKAKKRKL